jgi:alcohol dehydrogenase
MQALVFHGLGQKSLVERPKPTIALPTDVVVRITRTTICGSDLHILKGDVASCRPGTILGHQGVGVVDSVGAAVGGFQPGDRVLIVGITSCGRCAPCRQGMHSHCRNGGWLLGNSIDGTQAEYVRIPHADGSLSLLPANADEETLAMLSDALPTGVECGEPTGKDHTGSPPAIAGPVGVAALLSAHLYALPEIIIHIDENRLSMSKRCDATITIDSASIPPQPKSVQAKRVDAKQLITHRFKLEQILEAYDTFARAADSQALKVIIAT